MSSLRHVLRFVALLIVLLSMLACQAAPTPTPVPPTAAPKPTAVAAQPTTAPAQPTATTQPTAVPPTAVPPTKAPPTVAPTTAPTAIPVPKREAGRIILATTTSTADSGLLGFILPDFEKKFGVKVDVVAVGTGQAIQIGSKGDADVLLVHDRKREDQFIKDGFARERFDVMYNDYILLSPKNDPAKVVGQTSVVDAFKAIATAKANFTSRGDASGTNSKELSLWSSAAITPTKEMGWYKALGQGMGETLLTSNEMGAYTISDRGTYLSMKDKLTNLVVAVGGNSIQENKDKGLLNPYGVFAVNPDKFPAANYEMGMNFVNWITSLETQQLIGSYGVDKYGQPLFYADSAAWRKAHPTN
jgi:tungstate transport system substrate-binding protein